MILIKHNEYGYLHTPEFFSELFVGFVGGTIMVTTKIVNVNNQKVHNADLIYPIIFKLKYSRQRIHVNQYQFFITV